MSLQYLWTHFHPKQLHIASYFYHIILQTVATPGNGSMMTHRPQRAPGLIQLYMSVCPKANAGTTAALCCMAILMKPVRRERYRASSPCLICRHSWSFHNRFDLSTRMLSDGIRRPNTIRVQAMAHQSPATAHFKHMSRSALICDLCSTAHGSSSRHRCCTAVNSGASAS
jgi:hypothetical protein